MATILKIRDWDKYFENNRTRELKRLDWVPMPVKMDGDGYTELVDHPHGAAHFGAWCAIVEVAAKCEPRGTLLRDGQKPHDAASLARVTRLPVKVFDDVIPRLLVIGWLESQTLSDHQVTTIPQEDAGIPQDDATKSHLPALNGREWNGREQKGREEESSEPADAAALPPAVPNDGSDVVVMEFGCVGGRRDSSPTWQLRRSFLDELAAAYPGVDVMSQARQALLWTKANPTRRKTAAGMPEFLRRWMARAQDSGGQGNPGRRNGAQAPPRQPPEPLNATRRYSS